MGILNRKTVDHVGMVVKDVEKTAAQMEAMLGFGPWVIKRADDPNIGAKTLVAKTNTENGVEIELIQVLEGPIYHEEFVEKVGEGIQHLGFASDDVERDTNLLVEQGAEIVMHYPGRVSYLRFKDDGGLVTELYRAPQR